MFTFILISLAGGLLFGVLDGVINANPIARRLFEVYKPISRKSINPIAGVIIDLFYGFVMVGVFLLLYRALPGSSGILKGLSFALLAWFFRVVMYTASQWIMFTIPVKTLLYSLITGLGEMVLIGGLFGLTLAP